MNEKNSIRYSRNFEREGKRVGIEIDHEARADIFKRNYERDRRNMETNVRDTSRWKKYGKRE